MNNGGTALMKAATVDSPTSSRCTLQHEEEGCGSVLSRTRSSETEQFRPQTRTRFFVRLHSFSNKIFLL